MNQFVSSEKTSRSSAAAQRKQEKGSALYPDLRPQSVVQQKKSGAIQRVAGMEEEEDLIQGKFSTVQRVGAMEEEEELVQGKFKTVQRQGIEEEDMLQGKFEQAPVQRQSTNQTGLPDSMKANLESTSGMSMDDVRVHYNSSKPAPLQAHAYTQGTDIHVAPGQEKHLGHEAWHVVQQKQGRVQPTMSLNGKPVNDNAGLEREADVMGGKL
jgi:hypothetical protein